MEHSLKLRRSAYATLPLILVSASLIAASSLSNHFPANIIVWGGLLSMYAALVYGWLADFPRWTYTPVGFSIFFGFYLTGVSVPALGLHEVLGFYGLAPLAAAIAIPVLIRPSLKPARIFISKIMDDKSLILLLSYGFLPVLFCVLSDETTGISPLIILSAAYFILSLGAFIYYYSKAKWLGLTALIAGGFIPAALLAIFFLF